MRRRWLVAACCLVAASGCVRRSLTIRTEPPGALVYVNDELRGPSPVSYNFQWYGGYRLTLRKEGFERLDDRRLLRTPFYLWIPLDLAMELLPVTIQDRREWSYVLTPVPAAASMMPVAPPAAEPAADGGSLPSGEGGVDDAR